MSTVRPSVMVAGRSLPVESSLLQAVSAANKQSMDSSFFIVY
jgi:hypothetical protein